MSDFPWPSDIIPYVAGFYLQHRTGGTESPFSRATKVYGLSKPIWVCSLRLRAPDSADKWAGDKAAWGERIDAFLAQLDGRLNRVQLWDFRRPGRAPLFSNAAVTAGDGEITLTGASVGEIRVGEYVGGDGRPHIITKLRVSGSDLIADVRPYFETDIAAGAATFERVPGFFRLTSDDAGVNATGVGELTEYQLDFVEDYGPTVDVTFGDDVVTYSLPGSPPPSGPTLGTITLSGTSFTAGTPSSGTINGATAGSTITMSGLPAGLTINSAARTWAWDGTGTAGSGSITPTETLAGATNSPHSSPAIGYTISAAAPTDIYRVWGELGDSTGQGILARDTGTDLNWGGKWWGVDSAGTGYHAINSSIPWMVPNGDNRTNNRLHPTEYLAKAEIARTGQETIMVPMPVAGTRMFSSGHLWTIGDNPYYEQMRSEVNLAMTAAQAAKPGSVLEGFVIQGMTNDGIAATSSPGTITRAQALTWLTNTINDLRNPARFTGASSTTPIVMVGMDREFLKGDATNRLPLEFAMQDAHANFSNIMYFPQLEGEDSGDNTHPGLPSQRRIGAAISAARGSGSGPVITTPTTISVYVNQPVRIEMKTSGDVYATHRITGGADAASFEMFEEFFAPDAGISSQRVTNVLRVASNGTFASAGTKTVQVTSKGSDGRTTVTTFTIPVLAAYGTASAGAVTHQRASGPTSLPINQGLSTIAPVRQTMHFEAGLNWVYFNKASATPSAVKVAGIDVGAPIIGTFAQDRFVVAIPLAQAGDYPIDIYGSGTLANCQISVETFTNTVAAPNAGSAEWLDLNAGSITSVSKTINTGGIVFAFGYAHDTLNGDALASPSAYETGLAPTGTFTTYGAYRTTSGTISISGSGHPRGMLIAALDKAP